jgi:Flp pilus assembly protein TadB
MSFMAWSLRLRSGERFRRTRLQQAQKGQPEHCFTTARSKGVEVSRPLCLVALLWILAILVILIASSSTPIDLFATILALAVGAVWYFWKRSKILA